MKIARVRNFKRKKEVEITIRVKHGHEAECIAHMVGCRDCAFEDRRKEGYELLIPFNRELGKYW